MKSVLFVFAYVLCFISFAKAQDLTIEEIMGDKMPTVEEEKIIFTDEKGEEVFYVDKDERIYFKTKHVLPVNGVVVRKYPDGQVFSQYFCKNGYVEGVAKHYYQDGKLSDENEYKRGKLHGLAKSYHRDGWLRSESYYKDGKQEGIARMYYPDGQVMDEFLFKNGKLEGVHKTYDDNGELLMESVYENDTSVNGKVYNDGKVVYESTSD